MLNPIIPSGPFCPYKLDESSHFRDVWRINCFFFFQRKYRLFYRSSVNLDQTAFRVGEKKQENKCRSIDSESHDVEKSLLFTEYYYYPYFGYFPYLTHFSHMLSLFYGILNINGLSMKSSQRKKIITGRAGGWAKMASSQATIEF